MVPFYDDDPPVRPGCITDGAGEIFTHGYEQDF